MPIMSKSEDVLARELEKKGLKFKRQYLIDGKHVDFAFPDFFLIVEIDGEYFHNASEDKKRDDRLNSFGWEVKRFDSDFTFKKPDYVSRRIEEELVKKGYKREIQTELNKKPAKSREPTLTPTKVTKEPFIWKVNRNLVPDKRHPELKRALIKEIRESEQKSIEVKRAKEVKKATITDKERIDEVLKIFFSFKYLKKSVVISIKLIIALFIFPIAFYAVVYTANFLFMTLNFLVSLIVSFLFSLSFDKVFNNVKTSFLGNFFNFLKVQAPNVKELIWGRTRPVAVIITIIASFIAGFFKLKKKRY